MSQLRNFSPQNVSRSKVCLYRVVVGGECRTSRQYYHAACMLVTDWQVTRASAVRALKHCIKTLAAAAMVLHLDI